MKNNRAIIGKEKLIYSFFLQKNIIDGSTNKGKHDTV